MRHVWEVHPSSKFPHARHQAQVSRRATRRGATRRGAWSANICALSVKHFLRNYCTSSNFLQEDSYTSIVVPLLVCVLRNRFVISTLLSPRAALPCHPSVTVSVCEDRHCCLHTHPSISASIFVVVIYRTYTPLSRLIAYAMDVMKAHVPHVSTSRAVKTIPMMFITYRGAGGRGEYVDNMPVCISV